MQDQALLDWRLELENGSGETIRGVSLRVAMASPLRVQKDSVRVYNANSGEQGFGLDGDALTANGYDVGGYTPGSNVVLTFQTSFRDGDSMDLCDEIIRSFAFAGYDGQEKAVSFADIEMLRPCE